MGTMEGELEWQLNAVRIVIVCTVQIIQKVGNLFTSFKTKAELHNVTIFCTGIFLFSAREMFIDCIKKQCNSLKSVCFIFADFLFHFFSEHFYYS